MRKNINRKIDEEKTKANELQDRIRSWARNKTAMSDGPTPMDIGRVDDEEIDVDAVSGWKRCYDCSGWGYVSRECPSEKKGG